MSIPLNPHELVCSKKSSELKIKQAIQGLFIAGTSP
jgi:hypothetical protein